MSKAERLNERVSELLTAAVQRVLEAVRDTVREYEEKSAHTQMENERLRRRVQELQDQLDRDTAGRHKVLAPLYPEQDRFPFLIPTLLQTPLRVLQLVHLL